MVVVVAVALTVVLSNEFMGVQQEMITVLVVVQ